MDDFEMSRMPCSFGLLVDPSQAIAAAQRLHEAAGSGLTHSGWFGRTTPRGQVLPSPAGEDDEH